MTQARTLALRARSLLRQSELDLLKLRLASINILTSLTRAERDLLEAQISAREPRLEVYKQQAQALLEARVRDARKEAEKQESRTAELPEAIELAETVESVEAERLAIYVDAALSNKGEWTSDNSSTAGST